MKIQQIQTNLLLRNYEKIVDAIGSFIILVLMTLTILSFLYVFQKHSKYFTLSI